MNFENFLINTLAKLSYLIPNRDKVYKRLRLFFSDILARILVHLDIKYLFISKHTPEQRKLRRTAHYTVTAAHKKMCNSISKPYFR